MTFVLDWQASLGDAMEAAKGGLDKAKEAGLGLLSKAQNLVSGGSKAEASISQEL